MIDFVVLPQISFAVGVLTWFLLVCGMPYHLKSCCGSVAPLWPRGRLIASKVVVAPWPRCGPVAPAVGLSLQKLLWPRGPAVAPWPQLWAYRFKSCYGPVAQLWPRGPSCGLIASEVAVAPWPRCGHVAPPVGLSLQKLLWPRGPAVALWPQLWAYRFKS